MKNAFTFKKRDDGIGILYFDIPGESVNKFNTPVMEELEATAEKIKSEDLKCLLFMSGKESPIFIAGADISEIKDLTDPEVGYQVALRGQFVFDKFAQMPFPTISVINGACMGGGTELSLACTYRVATDSPATKIALPEVNLGILPGWGGTQRLPRLIGLQRSLDFILTGKNLNAKRAYRAGIIDKIITAEWVLEDALKFANEIISGETEKYIKQRNPKGLASAALEKTSVGRNIMFSQAEKMVMKKSGGHYPAPLRILKVLKQTVGMPLQKGLEIEARALGDLIVTPICKSLVQIFLWTEEIKKENGTSKKTVKTDAVKKTAVLGAGVMGGGIAQLFAAKSIDVRVKDINHDAVAKAYQQAASILKEKVKRRRLTKEKYREIMLRITGTTDYSGFNNTDLVVEAIVEDLDIKKSVLAELEKHVSKDTIIASNTSSLLIDDMSPALKNKKRFAGMHFFNPVHKMPLVEVIRGKETSDKAIATVFELCKKTGKTPIVVNDGPGFLVNRLLLPYMVEAVSLLEEGHSIQELDKVMKKFGMPMGPIELFDEVGIDVAAKVAKILRQTMADRMAESDLLDNLVRADRLGKKNKIGFYKYEGRKKIYDPMVETFIKHKEKTELSTEQLQQRMVYPMINEAARCLEDGIASCARDVDIGMIFGTGFAPFRGGLLKFADSEGLEKVIATLIDFEKKFGSRFKPADYLVKIKKGEGSFYE
jgi:3-hydroxyacyl-CoA dehydrogenase / enoyl-CoA hydratase / 3-hydroxybutyryl-CoA epimerase